jgi:hypothetical protein
LPVAGEDVVNARVYEAIHFRTSDLAGKAISRSTAGFIFDNVITRAHELECDD